MSPRPLDTGDQRHLPWGSARWSICRQMRLGVEALAQAGGDTGQYAALLAGADVALTAEQVRSFLPEEKWPATLDKHLVWVLSGADTLKPRRRRRKG